MNIQSIGDARLWYITIAQAILVFILSAGYMWLRRFGIPFDEVLFKISFAGIAVAGTLLLTFSYAIGPLARFWPNTFIKYLSLRKYYGMVGYWIIVVHVVWAIFVYESEGFNLLFGMISFVLFSFVAVTSFKSIAVHLAPPLWKKVQRVGYIALAFALLHVIILKYEGWIAIEKWSTLPSDIFGPLALVPLPPLTLILSIIIIAVFILRGLTLVIKEDKN